MSGDNKAIMRRFTEEVINQKNIAAADEFLISDFVFHDAPPGVPQGRESYKLLAAEFFTAFPDIHATIEDLIAEGDQVAGRVTTRGTHAGEFMGVAPTGKSVTWSAMFVFRFVGGKAVERWEARDALGLLQQLGVVTTPS